MPTASAVIRSPRPGSSANSVRKCSFLACLLCVSRAFHAGRALVAVTASGSASTPIVRLTFPKSKSSRKGIRVIADAAQGRHFLHLFHVAASQHDFVRFEGSDKAVDNVADVTPPFLSTVHLQAAFPDVVFEHAFLVREMTE